jgi:hypothetical protein
MPLTLNADTCILSRHGHSSAIQYAVNALAEDVEEVLGARPSVTEIIPNAGMPIIVEQNGPLSQQYGLADRLKAPERFAIRAVRMDGREAVLIAGSDERGTIHGIYHFSERHLGTDPLKFWTMWTPPRQKDIALSNLDHDSVAPSFRFRGWHMERVEDIFGWRTPDGQFGYHCFWEKVCETLLRLRGNMIKPSTNVPSSPEVAICQRMGLLITQEHGAPLGFWNGGFRDCPGGFPSFHRNPRPFLEAWEKSIRLYPRPENVLWTTGFRGAGDRPFWIDDPSAATDAERGAIISAALRAQVDLVKRHYGHHNPVFIHNLWMEGVRLFREGHVRVPEEALIVWADNGYGTFRAMLAAGCDASQMCPALPDAKTGGRHGVYCHVSMYDANAPDLMQFVPPERVKRTA